MLPENWIIQVVDAKNDYEKWRRTTEFLVLPMEWAADLTSAADGSHGIILIVGDEHISLYDIEVLFGCVEKPIACGKYIQKIYKGIYR